jgi:hypothetical protein
MELRGRLCGGLEVSGVDLCGCGLGDPDGLVSALEALFRPIDHEYATKVFAPAPHGVSADVPKFPKLGRREMPFHRRKLGLRVHALQHGVPVGVFPYPEHLRLSGGHSSAHPFLPGLSGPEPIGLAKGDRGAYLPRRAPCALPSPWEAQAVLYGFKRITSSRLALGCQESLQMREACGRAAAELRIWPKLPPASLP